MSKRIKTALLGGMALVLAASVAIAEEERGREHEHEHPAMQEHARPVEPHAGPSGYQRHEEPQGWNARPSSFDRHAYQHNYQASRGYAIGPYHHPNGWPERRWGYGEILPPAFWAAEYILADYWLFGLEVPPMGYEWVRIGPDAALIYTLNGEILQMEYGVFR